MKANNANIFRSSMLGIAAAGCMVAMPASAEDIDVSASVAVSNLYLFRGADLGNGRAMVSGDLVASTMGFYGGVWATSGDGSAGTEYDLFVGYGTEFDGVSVDISVINYMYPNDDANDTFGAFSEVFLNVGFMGFSFDYQDNVAGASGFEYYAFSYTHDKYTVLIGMVDNEEPSADALSNDSSSDLYGGDVAVDYTHLDISYQYNDNLSFTVSKVIGQDEIHVGDVEYDDNQEDDLFFVVNYSLPIDVK
ncbi:MAG: TorF family putative porin [Enterobacterales bacterium]|nr:TorF family putative porin [Enterobacterales bacterium]